ncbi:hypothetical protein PI125_g4476 [Phytophthora idaei]|nr:hypothetical protein PI125_g4476 [Phytophthora idaei]
MRVLSIVVNTAACERLFSELGIIHMAKRNHLASDKALDIQTVAQHVCQRALKHEALNPKKKLLVCPDEREIVRGALIGMFTPSPQTTQARSAVAEDDNNDGEDTLSLWREYLDEFFAVEEIDTGYEEAASTLNQQREDDADKFEAIAPPVLNDFLRRNDPAFSQEKKS